MIKIKIQIGIKHVIKTTRKLTSNLEIKIKTMLIWFMRNSIHALSDYN
mgnify:CR=1 FL=1